MVVVEVFELSKASIHPSVDLSNSMIPSSPSSMNNRKPKEKKPLIDIYLALLRNFYSFQFVVHTESNFYLNYIKYIYTNMCNVSNINKSYKTVEINECKLLL